MIRILAASSVLALVLAAGAVASTTPVEPAPTAEPTPAVTPDAPTPAPTDELAPDPTPLPEPEPTVEPGGPAVYDPMPDTTDDPSAPDPGWTCVACFQEEPAPTIPETGEACSLGDGSIVPCPVGVP